MTLDELAQKSPNGRNHFLRVLMGFLNVRTRSDLAREKLKKYGIN